MLRYLLYKRLMRVSQELDPARRELNFFYMDSIVETKVKVRLAIKVIGCRFQ